MEEEHHELPQHAIIRVQGRAGVGEHFEFMGNLNFLLTLVDELSIGTATRGALKEDTIFRGLQDVIKKCNKVLESMLIRHERKYTLMGELLSCSPYKMSAVV